MANMAIAESAATGAAGASARGTCPFSPWAMGMGLFAPPFGVGYCAACAISRISPDAGMKPIVGYMIALLISLIIAASAPWISTGYHT
ncbi:TRAP transporter large permease subunit [Xanthobacter sp. 126]|jgi:TRAP-type C4-dicarboxylate transport system permease large subunit|uniref:TRAP transporter large permease subunit n=1 Tax=Xanthobacter sp. 126 TaxID=1131814 RepID=UPI0018CC5BE1|nr:TRAP transporter large permease subunit [Xanthobacter sp. 126]